MAVTVKHWAAVGTPAETVPRPPVADAPHTPIYEALLHEWSRDGRTVPGEESGPSPSPWPLRRDRYDTASPFGPRTAYGAGGRRGEAGVRDGAAPAAPAAPLPAETPAPEGPEAEAGWQRIGTLRPSPRPTTARAALPAAATGPPDPTPESQEQRPAAGTSTAGTSTAGTE